MPIRLLCSCLALTVLAGCALPTQSKASRPGAAAAPKAEAPAAAVGTGTPQDAPAAGATTPETPAAAAPAAKTVNPFGVPTSVGLAMPKAFSGVIAAGAGNLISQAGGQVISSGGGNYRVQAGSNPTPAERLRHNMGLFIAAQVITESIMKKVAALNPEPGKPFTLEDPNRPGEMLTGLLEVLDDHALISIGRKGEAKGADQLISLAYTSEKAGKLIYRSPAEDAQGQLGAAITFDHDKGTSGAEAAFDNRQGIAVAASWAFEEVAGAGADAAAFKLRTAANVSSTKVKLIDVSTAISANFLPSGEAAFIGGLKTPLLNQGKFIFLPQPGIPLMTPDPKPHDHYMGSDGKDMAADAASAALKAILPADEHLLDPLPKATADSLASFVFE